jgi:transcriptional regulator
MYIPDSFNVTDEAEIVAFIERYDFATLVSVAGGSLTATHVPVIVERESSGLVIVGHLARANPHWRAFDGATEALLIFHGPHGYISPTWYVNAPAVPTWNYAVVHASGRPQSREDAPFIENELRRLVDRYEGTRAGGWRIDGLPAEYLTRGLAGIVGFEMKVQRLEAKFKLGQNRAVADRAGTIAGLERDASPEGLALATFTRAYLERG